MRGKSFYNYFSQYFHNNFIISYYHIVQFIQIQHASQYQVISYHITHHIIHDNALNTTHKILITLNVHHATRRLTEYIIASIIVSQISSQHTYLTQIPSCHILIASHPHPHHILITPRPHCNVSSSYPHHISITTHPHHLHISTSPATTLVWGTTSV